MTDDRSNKPIDMKQSENSLHEPLSRNKRRRLLKGAVALPVIMTLHSGAALARTSNLIGQETDEPVTADLGNGPQLLCMHPDPNEDQIPGGPYDLGSMPEGHYEQNISSLGEPISLMEQMNNCESKGGIAISATAYTSLMGKSSISINSTTW